MNTELNEIWEAMKDTKFRKTLEELKKLEKACSDDIDAFLPAMINITVKAIHAEAGTLWFYSRLKTGKIHPKAAYGGTEIGDFSLLPGEGVAGKVIETGEPSLIQDCQADPRWSGKVDKGTGFMTKSMMCVPLKAFNGTFGCIQIINKDDGTLFDERDYEFAKSLADEISRIFSEHAETLLTGYATTKDIGNKEGMNFILNAETEEEFTQYLRHLREYRELPSLKAAAFERHCKKLWKLLH